MAEAIIYQPSESQADLTGYSLVFQDEFDAIGQQPSSDNWTYDLGTSGDGWGNGEVQSYESDMDDAEIIDWDPSDEVNGALRITAKNVDGTITSARVKSDIDVGPYGYYEVRAKLPSEDGAWPAIWLLGEGGRATWPHEGEIDMVEWSSAEGAGNRQIISALHRPAESVVERPTLDGAVDEWHIYQLWWTPDSIKIGVDGTESDAHLVLEKSEDANNDTWPFDGPMDIILNIAIGGTLGGAVPESNFEYAMDVDYVRVYRMDDYGEEEVVGDAVFDGLEFSADSTAEAFEGSLSQVIADTTDGAADGNFVVEYTKTPDSKNYAGVTVGDLSANLVDDIPFDIGGGATAITARIHTAEAGKVVRMQVADSASGGDANYVHAEVTLANVGWNEVTFDFASPVARYSNTLGGEYTTELSADVVYDEISIFPDWENGLAWTALLLVHR